MVCHQAFGQALPVGVQVRVVSTCACCCTAQLDQPARSVAKCNAGALQPVAAATHKHHADTAICKQLPGIKSSASVTCFACAREKLCSPHKMSACPWRAAACRSTSAGTLRARCRKPRWARGPACSAAGSVVALAGLHMFAGGACGSAAGDIGA